LIGGHSWNIKNDRLKNWIASSLENNMIVGAICGAVDFLAKSGLINHYNHTGNALFLRQDYPNYTTHSANFIEQQAV
jgi:putative intracellular protease/amidase